MTRAANWHTPADMKQAAPEVDPVRVKSGRTVYILNIRCTLIEVWERGHVAWPKVSGVEFLKHLLENNGLTGADLSRLLGVSSPRLGPMILRGERRLTADHARRLGEHFRMEPGAFLK